MIGVVGMWRGRQVPAAVPTTHGWFRGGSGSLQDNTEVPAKQGLPFPTVVGTEGPMALSTHGLADERENIRAAYIRIRSISRNMSTWLYISISRWISGNSQLVGSRLVPSTSVSVVYSRSMFRGGWK